MSCAFTHGDDYGGEGKGGRLITGAAAVSVKSVTRVIGLVQEGAGTFRGFYIFGTADQTTVVRPEIVHHQVILLLFSPFSEHPGFGGIAER